MGDVGDVVARVGVVGRTLLRAALGGKGGGRGRGDIGEALQSRQVKARISL